MINKTFRRLALGAAAVTVAGVVVPVALASAANAAEATGITASPSSQTVSQGTPAVYGATLTPAGATSTHGVYYAVTAGPSNVSISGTQCTPNGGGTGPFSCSVTTTGFTAGTYTITIFDDVANTTTFQNADPNTTVSLTVAGTAANFTISPASQSAAQNMCAVYKGTAKDLNGSPAVGQTVSLTATQATSTAQALGSPNGPAFCSPTSTTFANATPPSTQTGTAPNFTDTATGTATVQSDGSFTFGVISDLTGTVNIQAGGTGVGSNPAKATLTVDPGTSTNNNQTQNNDVAKGITVTPTALSGFANKAATYTATVTNANGDVLGGVQPSYVVTAGADKGMTHTCTVSNGRGVSTCSITPSAATTDGLTTWVEQDNNPPNNAPGPNAGEPQTTSTVTATAEPPSPALAHNCAGALNPTTATCTVQNSQATEVVTFTLTDQGGPGNTTEPTPNQTLLFSTTSTDPGVSISPASATTNAQGQASVTVTHPAGTNNNVPVTATLAGDSTITDTVTVSFVPSASSSGTLSLSPSSQTKTVGSQVTVTAKAVDQFGNPVSGDAVTFVVSGRNSTANNPGATGSCVTAASGTCTFTYTDKGAALSGPGPYANNVDTINATDVTSGKTATAATVTFLPGTATAASVTLAAHSTTSGTHPTGAVPAGGFDYVSATVKDQYGNVLANDTVTFTSTGAGGFVDANGNSLGTTTTVATNGSGVATVNVNSTSPGQQTVSASADGVQSNPVTITYANSAYNPVIPTRLVDTRTGQGGISVYNGSTAPAGPLAPNTLYDFDLSNTNAPLGAAAYVFNVTVIGPTSAGNLRIAPYLYCGTNGTPTTSLVNFQPGKDVANSIVIPNPASCGLGSESDQFTIYLAGSAANVAIDLQGFYTSTNEFTGITPTRVADTRNSGGPLAANTSQAFQISGPAGLPAGAKAVALNVTAIGPTGLGNLRIYPDGSSVPTTSNINYIPGVDKAAFVVVQLPADGKIDVYSAGSPVNVAIDVFGYYPSTATVVTQAPVRVFDSRSGAGTELKAGVPVDVPVTTPGVSNGVPANAQAVLVSLTAIHAADSTGIGNLRAYPTGTPTPTVSNINYVGPDWDVANFAIVPIGANGEITLYSAGSNVNATVDILGYVPAAS